MHQEVNPTQKLYRRFSIGFVRGVVVDIVIWCKFAVPSENSSVGRAQPCQGWGREFESRFSLIKGRPQDVLFFMSK